MAAIVNLCNLSKQFLQRRGVFGASGEILAVREVSLEIARGETLGIVGESGCGKSTLGRMAVGLLEPDGGDVLIRGKNLYNRSAHDDYRAFRRSLAGVVQMVFQDPYSSLSPRMRIGESVAEPLRCSHSWLGTSQSVPAESLIRQKVLDMLGRVGLDSDAAARYPHEFSGGQRQRIAIARALITHPAFVVCDEPTSSLDASVQSQVLNLLRDMQEELGLTYCFISHDLAVVRHMSDRVAVMYKGSLVEEGAAEDVFAAPCHPYTRLLLDSVPGIAFAPEKAREDLRMEKTDAAKGVSDNDADDSGFPAATGGCAFAPRCSQVSALCRNAMPPLLQAPDQAGRLVRCHLFDRA